MTFAGERYYDIYRFMLTTVGLWPYRKPLIIQPLFIFYMYFTYITFQLTTFMTRTCNFEYVIRELSYILPTLMDLLLYCLFYFNSDLLRQLLDHIKADWNALEDSSEIKILEKYAFENRIVTIILVCLVCWSVWFVAFVEFLPIGLDIVAPLNVSRPRKLKIDLEFFIDPEEYFYLYLAEEIGALSVAFYTLVTTGTVLLVLVRHCCATYKVASKLIENTVTEDALRIPENEQTRVMCRRISRAVRIHIKTIQFLKHLMETLNRWFFFITAIGVLSLTCNLLRLLNAATLLKELSEVLMCLGVVLIHFEIMFLSNFLGQSIIDHSAEIFHAAYKTMWYLAPLPIQKMLLIIMQNTLNADNITIGGIYVACLEGFSTLVTTSISYFTVIYNINY